MRWNSSITQNLAVGDAVERDAADKAEVFGVGLLGSGARKPQHHLFGRMLDAEPKFVMRGKSLRP